MIDQQSKAGRWLSVESDEFLHFDVLRFLSAIAIMIFHFRAHFFEHPPADARLDATSLCVDLFFFISGFIITTFYGRVTGLRGYRRFLRKRLARLYPLHVLTALLFIAIGVAHALHLFPLRQPEQFDFRCLPANLLLLHAAGVCQNLSFNPVSWSISAEMIMYAIFPAILYLRRAGPLILLAASIGVIALMHLALGSLSPRVWTKWTYDYGVIRALPSFMLGMFCYEIRATLARLPHASRLMWLLVAIFCAGVAFAAPRSLLLLDLYAVAVAGIAADQQRSASRVVRSVAPLGRLTYSLYMGHPVVDMTLISFLGMKVLKLTGTGLQVWIGLCFVLTVPLAWFTFRFIEDPLRVRLSGAPTSRQPRPVIRHVTAEQGIVRP